MEMDAWQLQAIIREAAKEAVAEFARHLEPTKDEITYSQACREFGEGWLDNQIAIGAAKCVRKGIYKRSPKIFSRKDLKALKEGPSQAVRNCF